ncbi:hypothetical protein BSKO_06743 [Bryopsis sp. KO-2023]|nr:hypothetical protein BSKO_06743 [Bryopsis sp. KO-2023]
MNRIRCKNDSSTLVVRIVPGQPFLLQQTTSSREHALSTVPWRIFSHVSASMILQKSFTHSRQRPRQHSQFAAFF